MIGSMTVCRILEIVPDLMNEFWISSSDTSSSFREECTDLEVFEASTNELARDEVSNADLYCSRNAPNTPSRPPPVNLPATPSWLVP